MGRLSTTECTYLPTYLCGNLVPLTFGGVWQYGRPNLRWCVVTFTPYRIVV